MIGRGKVGSLWKILQRDPQGVGKSTRQDLAVESTTAFHWISSSRLWIFHSVSNGIPSLVAFQTLLLKALD
jgi:hypothetical protein